MQVFTPLIISTSSTYSTYIYIFAKAEHNVMQKNAEDIIRTILILFLLMNQS